MWRAHFVFFFLLCRWKAEGERRRRRRRRASRRKEKTTAIAPTETTPKHHTGTHTSTHTHARTQNFCVWLYISTPDSYTVVMCSYLLNWLDISTQYCRYCSLSLSLSLSHAHMQIHKTCQVFVSGFSTVYFKLLIWCSDSFFFVVLLLFTFVWTFFFFRWINPNSNMWHLDNTQVQLRINLTFSNTVCLNSGPLH